MVKSYGILLRNSFHKYLQLLNPNKNVFTNKSISFFFLKNLDFT